MIHRERRERVAVQVVRVVTLTEAIGEREDIRLIVVDVLITVEHLLCWRDLRDVATAVDPQVCGDGVLIDKVSVSLCDDDTLTRDVTEEEVRRVGVVLSLEVASNTIVSPRRVA